MRVFLGIGLCLALGACGGGDCFGQEYLSYHNGEVVVMTPSCNGEEMRIATQADMDRLAAPL